MKKFCLALDLVDNKKLIDEYINHHRSVWPEVESSIINSGIEKMEIYSVCDRLFMIIHVNKEFSFENKSKLDIKNKVVQKWEVLMSKYQKKLPDTKKNEKWKLMNKIYELEF
jgi:L-rhamnose mutarotase